LGARFQTFRQSVRDGAIQLGPFVKTASHQAVEVLGVSGFDFAIVDSEHAPFDPVTLDRMALASHAASLPCLVRIPEVASVPIGQALDMGFAGIVAPHVKSAGIAGTALDAAKYARGARGFSPSTRAGGYGAAGAAAYRAQADQTSSLWCQIEDKEALAQLDAIAAVDDIDCLFLGRADLAQSLGVESQSDPKVVEAITATVAAGRRHGRTVGIYVGDTAEIAGLLTLGITVFVCGSDQSLMRAQGLRVRREFTDICAGRSRS
jgi:2-keto-3-deoxy-L-rhamnonate aldolase RhmA